MDLPEEGVSNAAWEVSNSGRRSGLDTIRAGYVPAATRPYWEFCRRTRERVGLTLVWAERLDREFKKAPLILYTWQKETT